MEADAKRLQAREEELMRRKQDIRNRLSQLKKERRELRSALEATAGEGGRGDSAGEGQKAPTHTHVISNALTHTVPPHQASVPRPA